MKTLKEASKEDIQTQYQQILDKISGSLKQIESLKKQIDGFEKEKFYFLGILDYIKGKEELVSEVKVEEVKIPEKKSDVIG